MRRRPAPDTRRARHGALHAALACVAPRPAGAVAPFECLVACSGVLCTTEEGTRVQCETRMGMDGFCTAELLPQGTWLRSCVAGGLYADQCRNDTVPGYKALGTAVDGSAPENPTWCCVGHLCNRRVPVVEISSRDRSDVTIFCHMGCDGPLCGLYGKAEQSVLSRCGAPLGRPRLRPYCTAERLGNATWQRSCAAGAEFSAVCDSGNLTEFSPGSALWCCGPPAMGHYEQGSRDGCNLVIPRQWDLSILPPREFPPAYLDLQGAPRGAGGPGPVWAVAALLFPLLLDSG